MGKLNSNSSFCKYEKMCGCAGRFSCMGKHGDSFVLGGFVWASEKGGVT